jgi:hypothetical protein
MEAGMSKDANVFSRLLAQAERGEAQAEVQLRQRLEPELVHIVRCTLHTGSRFTARSRQIFEEARRLTLDQFSGPEDREQLIQTIARSLCDSFIAGLRSRAKCSGLIQETVGNLEDTNR